MVTKVIYLKLGSTKYYLLSFLFLCYSSLTIPGCCHILICLSGPYETYSVVFLEAVSLDEYLTRILRGWNSVFG